MTIALRNHWRAHFGPLDLKMPDDGVGTPLSGPYPQVHEDSEDCINEDPHVPGTDGDAGPVNVGAGAGSGIVMGYSVQDAANVLRLEEATHKRTEWYNWEHWVRQIRYAIARTEMVRDTIGPRRVLQYANIARAFWDEKGPIYFGPGWRPDNLHQYHEEALRTPHVGLDINLRALGWVSYGEAMALKVDRNRNTAWAEMALDTFALAAIPGTGQVGSGPNTGGGATDPVNVQYMFHWGILAHGAMALAHRLGRPVPPWVIDGMNAILSLPLIPYYGSMPMAAFVYTDGGVLKAAGGIGQHGDPAFAFWSTNCATLYHLTGEQVWLDRIPLFGPTKAMDEQSRKFTMLARGLTA